MKVRRVYGIRLVAVVGMHLLVVLHEVHSPVEQEGSGAGLKAGQIYRLQARSQ